MELTYDLIKPILLESQNEESQMICKFKCKNSEEVIESTGIIRQEQNAKTKVIHIVKESVINEVKRAITSQLIRMIGGRAAGTASSVATTAIDSSRKVLRFTPGEKQDAIVDAFKMVANQFHYDEQSEEWVMMNSLSAFEQQILKDPVEEDYDRQILAKTLVELATLEDELSREEEDFIQSILPSENVLGYDMELDKNVSTVELQEVTHSARKSIYLIASVVALINRELTKAEKEKLSFIAAGLNIPEAEANVIFSVAQEYIIENAVAQRNLNKQTLFELADRISFSHDDAERVVIKYSQRKVS